MNIPWLSHLVPGNAPDGSPILSVLGKRTYRFENGKAARIDEDEQIPFIEADEFWGQGNPATDAARLESDLVAYKPMTDVILIGKAHVPGGRKTSHLDIGLQAGETRKIARVFGDRKVYVTASGLAFSDPEPFSEMPLDHSRAYGGSDVKSDDGVTYVYPRNPVGKGFLVKDHPAAVQDLVLPNLEHPQRLLTPQTLALRKFESWKNAPEPWAFGYQNKNFHPRYTLSGLAPDQWAQAETDRQRNLAKAPEVGAKGAPIPAGTPPMLNPQFFNGASKGLALPTLRGNEAFKLAHLDPAFPQFAFSLPGTRPTAWLDVGEGPEDMAMALHTVVIYKETNQVTLVWRGCSIYGGIESMKDFTAFEYGIKEA